MLDLPGAVLTVTALRITLLTLTRGGTSSSELLKISRALKDIDRNYAVIVPAIMAGQALGCNHRGVDWSHQHNQSDLPSLIHAAG